MTTKNKRKNKQIPLGFKYIMGFEPMKGEGRGGEGGGGERTLRHSRFDTF